MIDSSVSESASLGRTVLIPRMPRSVWYALPQVTILVPITPTVVRPSAATASPTMSVIFSHGIGQPTSASCTACWTALSGLKQNSAPHAASLIAESRSSPPTARQSSRRIAST